MMLHDWYRNKRDRHRRETEAKLRDTMAALQVAEERRREAEEALRVEEEERAAIEENRRTAEIVAQLRQDLDAWHAWNYRRLRAAEKGEEFNEPSPNATASQNGQ